MLWRFAICITSIDRNTCIVKQKERRIRRNAEPTVRQFWPEEEAPDEQLLQRVLDLQDGPTILVGHSWGGTVITEAHLAQGPWPASDSRTMVWKSGMSTGVGIL